MTTESNVSVGATPNVHNTAGVPAHVLIIIKPDLAIMLYYYYIPFSARGTTTLTHGDVGNERYSGTPFTVHEHDRRRRPLGSGEGDEAHTRNTQYVILYGA